MKGKLDKKGARPKSGKASLDKQVLQVTKPDEIAEVKITDIVVKKELYPRLEPSEDLIEKYSENLEILPPIVINQEKILIDGLHRLRAHERFDAEIKPTIKCIVEDIKTDEILMRAIELNSQHGLQLSYREKKQLHCWP